MISTTTTTAAATCLGKQWSLVAVTATTAVIFIVLSVLCIYHNNNREEAYLWILYIMYIIYRFVCRIYLFVMRMKDMWITNAWMTVTMKAVSCALYNIFIIIIHIYIYIVCLIMYLCRYEQYILICMLYYDYDDNKIIRSHVWIEMTTWTNKRFLRNTLWLLIR